MVLKEDKSMGSANVDVGKSSKNAVKRSDSVKLRKPSMNVKGEFGNALGTAAEFTLQPGVNRFTLTKRVDQPGYYRVSQLSLVVEKKLEFLSSVLEPRLCYCVSDWGILLKSEFMKIVLLEIFRCRWRKLSRQSHWTVRGTYWLA